jgi:signal transduction histidine kinase
MDRLIADVLTLARQGEDVGPMEPVALETATDWRTSDAFGRPDGDGPDGERDADAVDVDFETTGRVLADRGRLKRLLENLFRNAGEHGSDRVVVGDLDDGFYVADDGPGIPEERREEVFESGHTTSDDGTGFGLAIVERIAEAHGWELTLTEGDSGGARFEFRGVDRP